MKVPKSTKGLLSLLIAIAEEGNSPRLGDTILTEAEDLAIGGLIADIQNNLGEMDELLEKYGLEYRA